MNQEALRAVNDAFRCAVDFTSIYRSSVTTDLPHQFLFFAKPEMFDNCGDEAFGNRMQLLFDSIARFGFVIEEISLISGSFLNRHAVISDHYGVIDRVARDPINALSDEGKQRFHEIYGMSISDAPVVGGIDYIDEPSSMDAASLATRWLEIGFEKLTGGSYCQFLPGENRYLFNGFYPDMLNHYTRNEARIAVFVLRGAIGWEEARKLFVGATIPAKAEVGSIRRLLLDNRDALEIPQISANLNGVHLSAGALEGLVELLRFTDDRTSNGKEPSEFVFGRQLEAEFSFDQFAAILDNRDVESDGEMKSLYDLTEELDSTKAIAVLRSVVSQLDSEARA